MTEFKVGDQIVLESYKDHPQRIIWTITDIDSNGKLTLKSDDLDRRWSGLGGSADPMLFVIESPSKEIDYLEITKDIVGG